MNISNNKAVNLAGVESEVHIFFQNDVNEDLKTKAACMSLAMLQDLYGYGGEKESKVCPYTKMSCSNHEFLLNGSRVYRDHDYLEYSTAAFRTTSEAVAAIRAGDMMIRNSVEKLKQVLGNSTKIVAVRNNIDHSSHSFGAHVNIRMTRKGFERIFDDSAVLNGFIVPFFVTLPMICGAGRCSSEDGEEVFQIWQRADFLKELVGLQTTYDRPLVNTRDESLAADPEEYARFHIIAFDANRLEVAEYLKLGLLQLLCAAIDADKVDVALELDNPILAVRSISRNPFEPIQLASNKSITVLEIQHKFFDAFKELNEARIFTGRVPDADKILAQWDQVLTKLEKDPFSLIGSLDWITKYAWLEQIRNDKGLKWSSPQIKWLDIQYHSLTNPPDMPCEVIVTDNYIESLTRKPPQNCRATIRGELLRRFGNKIAEANWHYVVSFDNEIAYLLPDDPEPGSAKIIGSAKTLEEAATLLKLNYVRLDCIKETQVQFYQSSGLPEVQIVTTN